MAKRTRTSDMRNKVEFYKQSEIFDYNSGSYILSWGLEFTSWCRETTIYREVALLVSAWIEIYRNVPS